MTSTPTAIANGTDSSISDLELTRGVAEGDEAALRALVERLLDRVRRMSSYLAGSGPDAEDITQLALIRILRSAASFRGDSTLEFWADRITVHAATKEFEKRSRRSHLFRHWWSAPAPLPGLEEVEDSRRIRTGLAAALGKLSPDNRTAMVLHYFYGHDVSRAAEIIDVPVNTVRGRLRSGRRHLKRLMFADPLLRQWIAERIP